jgi:hypothetical protein
LHSVVVGINNVGSRISQVLQLVCAELELFDGFRGIRYLHERLVGDGNAFVYSGREALWMRQAQLLASRDSIRKDRGITRQEML